MIASDGPGWIVRLGGRRFVLAVLAQLAGAVLVWRGHIDGAIYVTLILGTVGAYITGNTVQRVKEIREAGALADLDRPTIKRAPQRAGE